MSAQASLVFTSPDGTKQDLPLERGSETTIGRHPQCTLTVSQPSVSRKHARFWFEDGEWFVEDLQSSNGTYVNNRRIEQEKLTEGDDVRCGDFGMKYVIEDHTREVGNIPPRKSVKKKATKPPRLVGQMNDRADIAGRATVGLADSSDALAELKANEGKKNNSDASSRELKLERERADALNSELQETRDRLERTLTENKRLKSGQAELEDAVAQRTDLERRVLDLETKNSELKNESSIARAALDEVREELESMNAKGNNSEVIDGVRDIFEDLDSFTSDLRLKLKLAAGLLDDLGPAIETLDSLAAAKLPAKMAQAIRSITDEMDSLDTFRAVQTTFEGAELAARRTRRLMRLLGATLDDKLDD